MPAPIIGLLGIAGSGKTLVAKHLVDEYGYHRTRFADPLKTMLRALGLTEAEVDGDHKMRPMERFGGVTPRHMMQTLGTEWGRRRIHPDLWVDAWKVAVANLPGPIVVDDVRFPNEAAAVWAMGGEVWRVFRPGIGTIEHFSEQVGTKIAENELLANATTIPALLRSVDTLMRKAA